MRRPDRRVTPESSPPDKPEPSSLVVTGGDLVIGPELVNGDVTVEGNRLTAVSARHPHPPTRDRDQDQDQPSFDASNLIVAPGLIDLQINGGYGHDLQRSPESLWALADRLPSQGVTAFCPTMISGPTEQVDAALDVLAARPPNHHGAEPLGLHLEGPLLAPSRRGAHDRRHLMAPDPTVAEGWARDRGVALVTLAPELPGALQMIRRLRDRGVAVAAGHTDATFDHGAEAEAAGVTLVTHLFNAMAPLHHRSPGLAGYTLGAGHLHASLIVDGIHVDPTVVKLAANALGPQRLILVSDAVAALGLEPGQHPFGGDDVTFDGRAVRHDDGTLAGSALTLDLAVRNLIEFTGWTTADALATVSANPARIVGMAGRRGAISVGSVADLVVLDQQLQVVATFCRGHLAHLDPTAADRLDGLSPPASP